MPRVSQQSIDEVLTMGIGWATLEEPADRRRAGGCVLISRQAGKEIFNDESGAVYR